MSKGYGMGAIEKKGNGYMDQSSAANLSYALENRKMVGKDGI